VLSAIVIFVVSELLARRSGNTLMPQPEYVRTREPHTPE
jgi:hypothetical protein